MPQMRLVMKLASRGSLPFLKMLYPRKMEEVLWHWATFLASKSILVKMPRLPTMRVIGSQFISTRFFDLLGTSCVGAVMVLIGIAPLPSQSGFCSMAVLIGSRVIPGGQFRAGMPPLRLFVYGVLGYGPQRTDRAPIHADSGAGNMGAWRFIHKWHELVGEARHGAADANAADVGTTTDASHPAAFGHVAVHDRAPAADLHDAFGRAVDFREIALLVISGTVAPLVHGSAEQPGGAQLIIQRDHWSQAGDLIKQIEDGLHEIVGLHGTARDIHDGQSGFGAPVPTQIIGQTHATGGISRHRVDAAVGGAGSDGHYG